MNPVAPHGQQRDSGRRYWRPERAWQPEGPSWVGLALAAPLIILFSVFFIWPIANLIATSLPGLSFKNYESFFQSPADVRALERTLVLTGIVTLLAVAAGVVVAWELRTARRVRRTVIMAIIIFPLWTSLIIRLYAFTILFQRRGVINNAVVDAHIRREPFEILYTDKAVVIGMFYTVLPFAVLPLYAAFVNIDLELVRAARSLGAGPGRSFLTVVLSLGAPSILATSALVFVIGLGFYVTPLLLGGAQSPFIAGRIANDIFVMFDLPRAAAAGTILGITAFACIAVTWRAVGLDRISRAIAQ